MNGRIYDPGIGRFLTADSFIQFSGNSQSYNRYAYVLNNPMRYSDPSGHFVTLAVGLAWAAAGQATISQMFVSFLVSMFAAGTVDALIAGADLDQALKAGAFTALSAAVAYGIGQHYGGNAFADGNWTGQAFGHELARAMSHGIAQGTISEVAGGDFGSGAAGGFFGSFAGKISDGMGLNDGASFVAAVAIGGTTAEIGGGKFANGAISAAFTDLFNRMTTNLKSNNEEGVRVGIIAENNPGDGKLVANDFDLKLKARTDLKNGYIDKLIIASDWNTAMAELKDLSADNTISGLEVYGHGGPGVFKFGYDDIGISKWSQVSSIIKENAYIRLNGCAAGMTYNINKGVQGNYAYSVSATTGRTVYAFTEVTNANRLVTLIRGWLGLRAGGGDLKEFRGYKQ